MSIRSHEGTSKTSVLTASIVILAVAAVAIAALLVSQRRSTATKNAFTIIGGELKEDAKVFGYALLGQAMTSPGPTIRVKKGDKVTITFNNVHGAYDGAKLFHNFVVVATKDESAERLWGAQVGENHPIYPTWIDAGESGTATFTPETAGAFFYICSVPGHLEQGMYGSLTVQD